MEMSYAGAYLLRKGGYTGKVKIGGYGINHVFLIIDDYIADPWAKSFFLYSQWRDYVSAYGGKIKAGKLFGHLLKPDHFELEDELPEVLDVIK